MTLNELKGEQYHDHDMHGEIVLWDLRTKEVELYHLRNAVIAAGIDDSCVRDLRPITAFKRAIAEYKRDHAIDKVRKQGSIYTFQFTKKELESAQMHYNYETVVRIDSEKGIISCVDNAIQLHASSRFSHCLTYRTTSDITTMIKRLYDENADLFPLIQDKGVAYFVPTLHRDFNDRIEQLLHAVGGHLIRFPVPKGNAKGNSNVRKVIESGLDNVLDDLRVVAHSFSTSTHESTMVKLMEKWHSANYKVDAYADYLGETKKRLVEKADEIKKELTKKILEVQDAKAAKGKHATTTT